MFIGVFSLVGVTLLLASHAATPVNNAFETEMGSVTLGAVIGSDTAASSGGYIGFTASTGGATPLPNPGTWTNVTGNLAGKVSECGNLSAMFVGPSNSANYIIAGIAKLGLWTNADGSSTWTQVAGSSVIDTRPSSLTYDPANPSMYYMSGIYGSFGDGIFKTTNGGVTFTQVGNIGHNDSVAVDFTDAARQTMLAGGHEAVQTVYKSTNGGLSWTNIGGTLPSDGGFSSQVIVISAQTYLVGVSAGYINKTSGIYRTTNGGSSWTKVSSLGPNSNPLRASDGTIYWTTDNGTIAKSTDSGSSWSIVGSGMSLTPVQLPDGRIVVVHGNTLAVSANSGTNWTDFGASLPYSPNNLSYAGGTNNFYVSHFDCYFDHPDTVPADAIEELR